MRSSGPGAGRALLAAAGTLQSQLDAVGVVVRSLLAAALVMLPVSSVGWGGLWTWAPDLAVVIAVLAACLALTAGLRLIGLSVPPEEPRPRGRFARRTGMRPWQRRAADDE